MNKRLYPILIIIALISLLSAGWLSYEASQLETRLLRIDQESQGRRLMDISLPRVENKLQELLQTELAKIPANVDFNATSYSPLQSPKADFNAGNFLLTATGLLVNKGEDDFYRAILASPGILDTIRRKADNPDAALIDDTNSGKFDPNTQLPQIGIYQLLEEDLSKPIIATGSPSSFYAWKEGQNLIYMRNIPTSHGRAAEGIVIDVEKLIPLLLVLVEPGLNDASIQLTYGAEKANLSPLPLVLHKGKLIELPEQQERKKALRGTLFSSWAMSIITIGLITALIILYARHEQRRGDFVSAVTHELRTPLTSFSLYTEMLKDGLVPAEKQKQYHQNLYQESQRLIHLVENVLSFAKLSRGKARGRNDSGRCGELLSPLLDKMGEHLKKANFQYSYTLDQRCKLVNLRTDLLIIEQILTNLADNAIKYAPADAITGQIAKVSIQALQTHRHLVLRFSDKGSGMSKKQMKKIFRPFHRCVEKNQQQKAGVGLGLALSRELARSIDAELKLEKSDSSGSTFSLSLPLAN